jgi:hypothetical protein
MKIASGTSAYDEYWCHVKSHDIANRLTHIAPTRLRISYSPLALCSFSKIVKHMSAMEKFVTNMGTFSLKLENGEWKIETIMAKAGG